MTFIHTLRQQFKKQTDAFLDTFIPAPVTEQFYEALSQQQAGVVKTLLRSYPRLTRWKSGRLVIAAAKENAQGIMDVLLAHDPHALDATHKNGETLLFILGDGRNHHECLNYLVKHGADIHARNARGETPLISAARRKANLPYIEGLLDNGADINARNSAGESALDATLAPPLNDPIFLGYPIAVALMEAGIRFNPEAKSIQRALAENPDMNMEAGIISGKPAIIENPVYTYYKEFMLALEKHSTIQNQLMLEEDVMAGLQGVPQAIRTAGRLKLKSLTKD